MIAPHLKETARAVLAACQQSGDLLATAESCTGGLVAAALTAIPGSSMWVDRGFVTYSNEAKADMLGVPMAMIEAHGAVSEEVARAMAAGAIRHSRASLAVAITGIAGPGGGSAAKPIGTVYLGICRKGENAVAELHHFEGNRDSVRLQSALKALALLKAAIPTS